MLRVSWGLCLDLGFAPSSNTLQAVYQGIWKDQTPGFTMGEFQGCPQAAEGKLTLNGEEYILYTRLEKDTLGYPQDWPAPVLLSVSLSQKERELKADPSALQKLKDWAFELETKADFQAGFIGNLTLYQFSSHWLAAWAELNHEEVLSLYLPQKHPLNTKEQAVFVLPETLDYPQPLRPYRERESDFKTLRNNHFEKERLGLAWEKEA